MTENIAPAPTLRETITDTVYHHMSAAADNPGTTAHRIITDVMDVVTPAMEDARHGDRLPDWYGDIIDDIRTALSQAEDMSGKNRAFFSQLVARFEAMAADRDGVRLVRDRYRRERDAARAEAARESKLVSEARHERDTARQEAREARREADADRARLLGIVAEWVHSAAEFGGVDHGDLCDDLRAAGYTLPDADEETDR